MIEKKEALKGRKVIIYARVSTDEQKGTLSTQVQAIKNGLKDLGFKGKAEVFQEQVSGTSLDRPALFEAIGAGLSSKKPAVLVVRDIQRFSRDSIKYGHVYYPMSEAEFPVLSINEPIVLPTRKVPQPSSALLAAILIAAGGVEVSTRLKQTLQGVAASREKGIFSGTPLSLFPDEILDPRRELLRLSRAGVGQSEGSRILKKSTSWWRKNLGTMKVYESAGVLDDWLDSITLIRNYEIAKGEGKGPKAGIKMKTVRRMTSGYLSDPTAGFPKPTQEDLDDYFFNFNSYKKKRQ